MSDKTSTPVPPKTVTGWEDVPKAIHSVPTSSSDLRPQPTGTLSHTGSQSSLHQASRPASYNTNSASSYATAVQVYTQKLSTLRPHSAKSTGPKTEKLRSRPSSAHMSRPTSAAHTAYGSTPDLQDPYNERVITEALQRLTMRQQARQYSAINSTSLVPSDTSRPSSAAGVRLDGENMRPWTAYETTGVTHTASQVSRDQGAAGDSGIVTSSKYISMEEHVSKNRPPSGTREMRVQSAIDLKTLESQRKKQTNVNLQSANATFNSFIDDHGQQWQNDLAMAYSQVTGVVPQNYHTPSQSSKQYQILQQQTQLKQQSKVLLEQSKAKHQAMIAQAHAVQKSLTRPESENTMVQMYAPKPPIKPGSRKATSSHHRMPRRTVPEETSLNFQFYSSNKPAMNGGW